MLARIVWVQSLTPQEYLTLLAIGDLMLDPFPFGGGVTTLESVSVCTPVITFPSAQSVPQLAAGECWSEVEWSGVGNVLFLFCIY